jgi:hypothetical protein
LLASPGCSSAPDGAIGRSSSSALSSGSPIQGYGGKCLDDSGDGTADGNKIQLWDCNGTNAQQWARVGATLVGPGGKCLDVQSDDQANGTVVQLWDCNGTPAQNWTFEGGTLVSAGGFCLDDTAFGTADGTQIEIWTCTGGANQEWTMPSSGPSANCTTITATEQTLDDAQGNVWSLSDGVVLENGSDAGYSANATELAYVNGEVYQENAAGSWWGWSGGTWVSASNPTANGCSVAPPPSAGFRVSNGQIIAPDGQLFHGKGINVYDSQMSSVSTASNGAPLTSVLLGINIVRLNVFSYESPGYYQTFIDQLTPLGIVVELEDHTNNAGNAGGGAGTVFSGSELTDELNWYSSVATAFASNPYVWFGTDNEPSEDPSAEALSTWQEQTYQAIRNAGNDSIVLVEMNCGSTPSSCGAGYTTSVYSGMTNIVWDAHYYGWLTGYSTDANTITQSLSGNAQAAQVITSADGIVPVIIGEYGVSTDGQNTDPNGTQVVTAVESSGYGCMAWGWDPGANDDVTDGSNNLTPYGQQVAQFIAN